MIEQEWLECADPTPMLEFLRGKASERKLRLFACACCRRIWRLLSDEGSHKAVEAVEADADRKVLDTDPFRLALKAVADTTVELADAAGTIIVTRPGVARNTRGAQQAVLGCSLIDSWEAAFHAADRVRAVKGNIALETVPENLLEERRAYYNGKADAPVNLEQIEAIYESGTATEGRYQSDLVRDIFGNPFRPLTVNSAWLMPTVVSLATAIYDDRAFDRLPILADALEDAGCTNADILNHCRQPGDHVRGCWVLTMILDKPALP
ncbi:MAG: hypothetical protein FD131_5181 [Rhodocyclaceae bacterium]|nr:MAG: hypothetical protein FD131_5181 [Rhodocyclaceae bacterium]